MLGELVRRGVTVVPQVGVAGYRIDLGVIDDAAPGRFLCGIECDGVAYHSSETARDRDRLRQQVLEARGWTIHRVWSTDWFKDRPGQVERLLSLIAQTRERAAEAREAERETHERETHEHDVADEAAREADARQADARESDAHDADTREATEVIAPQETPAGAPAAGDAPYVRPVAAPYASARGEGRYARQDLLTVPLSQVAYAVAGVVAAESPVHVQDVVARVVGMWGTRAGTRIQARVLDACTALERDGSVRRRGDFLWSASGDVTVRSRAGTRVPAERIAPEEYEAAVVAVLAGGHGFDRPQLVNEVRAVLGFGRTGAALDEAIGGAVERLVAAGRLGESSTGVRLRS